MLINDLVASEEELKQIILSQSRQIANLQRDYEFQREHTLRLENENCFLRNEYERLRG